MGKLGTSVIDQADTIVWLDLPLRTCCRGSGAVRTGRRRDRVELWNGNRENWRNACVGWNAIVSYTVPAHIGGGGRAAAVRGPERRAAPNAGEVEAWLAAQGAPG